MTLLQTAGTFAVAVFIPRSCGPSGRRGATSLLGAGRPSSPASASRSPRAPTPAFALFFFFLLGIGVGGVNTLMWALEADTVEYGEWKTGVRTEGTTYALFSFTRKMGQALGGAAAAYTIGLGGYIAGKGVVQTDSANTAIKVAAGLLPAGFILARDRVMLFYPLTETGLPRHRRARSPQRRASASAPRDSRTHEQPRHVDPRRPAMASRDGPRRRS